ncbi:MAG: hypothetical protein J1G04_01805 [Clostridiales bacterium]|nr:hypothetical protein [Clostridiales bacterium]
MDNKTMLLILMVVLIVFVVLLAVLGIVFIIALRKRAPVVKVVMAPTQNYNTQDHAQQPAVSADTGVAEGEATEGDVPPDAVKVESESEPELEPEPEPELDDDEEDDDTPTYVTEGTERVRYNRSLTAKLSQLSRESKEWYSELKNELLSYEKVKDRMSWKRETYRVGRMVIAKLIVRGKTLSLLLAVEPAGYNGTKFSVDDISNIASMADTPTMYRIKNPRRVKYAKEMIAGMMKELKVYKNSHYEAQDFFIPYEGDMAFMQRGLVKRIVSGTTRTFKIEEVDKTAQAEAAATNDNNVNA